LVDCRESAGSGGVWWRLDEIVCDHGQVPSWAMVLDELGSELKQLLIAEVQASNNLTLLRA